MPKRNTHRLGDYLMVDARTGYVHYASEMVEDWDGLMVRAGTADGEHPFQTYVPHWDEHLPEIVRPRERDVEQTIVLSETVGETGLPRARTPSDFLFEE